MDKQLFDLAIGEAPPSTVDVDEVVARERRVAWLYRAANPWVGAAVGVVAVAVSGVVFLAPGPSGGYSTPAAAETPSQVPVSTPTSPCGGITAPPTSEPPSAAITRLTGVLTTAVLQRTAPGTVLDANPGAQYPKGTPHGPLEFYHVFSQVEQRPNGCSGGEDYFSAGATTVLAEQKGSLRAIIGRLGGNASPSKVCDQGTTVDMQIACVRETGAGGEIVLKSTLTRSSGVGPTIYQVDVTKPDGTGIILYAENVGTDAKYGGQPTSPTPPLTLDQLAQIALDPQVTLYP